METQGLKLRFITPSEQISLPVLRKRFSCSGAKSASIAITGLGLYRAFINGKRVGEDYLTPGYNDYDAYLRYQIYDVSELIKEDNLIEIYLGDGWYKGRIGLGADSRERWGTVLMAAARLTIEDTDGNISAIETDDSWQAFRSQIGFTDIYDGEARDDTVSEGEPMPCKEIAAKWNLVPQFSPPVRIRALFKPELIITPKNEYVLDFKQNMAGIIRFVNRAPKGAKIHLQFGEVLQNGCFYRDNLRSAKAEYFYTSNGEVKEIEPFFTFYGFRYAKVVGLESVNPDDFTALALSSDLPVTIEAETGHAGINRLIHNAFWGQQSNFVDVPTDCPQRDERLGWTADTQVFVNTACYNMYCKDFYRKFMADMRYDQTTYCGGDIPPYSPSLKGAGVHGGAVWADAATIVPWNVYNFYGDKELLSEYWPMVEDYVEYLIKLDQKEGFTHTVYTTFTFGDWVAQDGLTSQSVFGGTENALIQGVYYMYSLFLASEIAKELGKEEAVKKYGDLYEEVKKALLDEYITPNGRLAVDTQTAYILALKYGLARDEDKLLSGLRRRFERDFYGIKSGFTGTPLMLPTLFDHGMDEQAYRILLRRSFPGWLYAVDLGATTVWERWNSLNPDGSISGTDMNSLNHYAYGSVCEAIYSRIIGLRNDSFGWKKAILAPHPDGRIGHASIKYASVSGKWELAWSIEKDGSLKISAVVPEGCEARVELPSKNKDDKFTVGSGAYTWTYMPESDYLHPYSAQSLVTDLMADEKTAAILKNELPSLYERCAKGECEELVRPLALCLRKMSEAEKQRIDEALKAVKL